MEYVAIALGGIVVLLTVVNTVIFLRVIKLHSTASTQAKILIEREKELSKLLKSMTKVVEMQGRNIEEITGVIKIQE